jgi:hypothetical protein
MPHAHRSALRGARARRQSGIAVLMLLTLLVLVGAALLLQALNAAGRESRQELATTRALIQAKDALIGLAVSHPVDPGMLPFPDRSNDGNYDGGADCLPVTVLVSNTHLLGHLPWQGQGGPCIGDPGAMGDLRDGTGAPLWYAVSENLVRRSDGSAFQDPPINPDWADLAPWPWITVRGGDGAVLSDRVAFVVIAPGVPLPGQSRSGLPAPADYLDSVTIGGTTHSNADFDQDFIIHPDSRRTADAGDSFNDRLVYVTIDELMPGIERRVLGTVAQALRTYRDDFGVYPWLSPFGDPGFHGAAGVREGHVPFHSAEPPAYRLFATALDASWDLQNADVVATGAVTAAEVASAAVSVAASAGSCRWAGPGAVDCTAKQTQSVTPPIERTYTFDFSGVPSLTGPSAGSVRRRTVAVADPAPLIGTQILVITDRNTATDTPVGQGSLTVDGDTTGSISVGSIRYDLGVPNELPQWFVSSRWQEFVYAAFSGGYAPGGPGSCGGTNPSCLTLLGWYPPQDDKHALVLSGGPALPGQDHSGAPPAVADYLEDENSSPGDDVFARRPPSPLFNDQVRIVAP